MNRPPFKQGIYTPQNMSKYIGAQLPKYRSSWELRAFMALDKNEKILRWGSENFVIPYIDRTRGNETHRYIIDLFFEIAEYTHNGAPIKWLIEIKPQSQATPKKYKRKPSNPNKALNDAIIIERNKCKWEAAVSFCRSRGWHFRSIYGEGNHQALLEYRE